MSSEYIDGSAEVMQSVRDFATSYSMWILGLAVILIIILLYKMMSGKKEGMYQPGATAWLTDSIARMEGFNIPSANQCASIDTAQLNLSGADAYRAWLAPKMDLNATDSSFEYAYDPNQPEKMTDAVLMNQMFQ